MCFVIGIPDWCFCLPSASELCHVTVIITVAVTEVVVVVVVVAAVNVSLSSSSFVCVPL